jgi:transposase
MEARIAMLEGEIKTWFRSNDLAKRLETIPGIGILTASALAASVTDPHQFTSARQFAASLGLTPKANSSGGRERMGRISEMGDRYLRRLLVIGMTSQLQSARCKPEAHPWVSGLLAKEPNKLVAVAMANKAARIAWVDMTRGEVYRARRPASEGTV